MVHEGLRDQSPCGGLKAGVPNLEYGASAVWGNGDFTSGTRIPAVFGVSTGRGCLSHHTTIRRLWSHFPQAPAYRSALSVSPPLSFQAGRGLFSNPNRGRFGDFPLGIERVCVRSFKICQSRWRSASRRASTALQEGNWPKHKARHWDSYSAANAIARLPVGNRALLLAKVIPGGAT